MHPDPMDQPEPDYGEEKFFVGKTLTNASMARTFMKTLIVKAKAIMAIMASQRKRLRRKRPRERFSRKSLPLLHLREHTD